MFSNIYAQKGHPEKKLFLSDEDRKRAALNMVRLCHDFVPIGFDGKLYLPKRKKGNAISEVDGVWFVGGAVSPFMDERQSMQNVLKRELGFEVDLSRLKYVCTNRYYMNGQAQGGFAHDAYCPIYALPLTEGEIASVKLDPDEYEGGSLQPYGLEEIEKIGDPFVRAIFLDLWILLEARQIVH